MRRQWCPASLASPGLPAGRWRERGSTAPGEPAARCRARTLPTTPQEAPPRAACEEAAAGKDQLRRGSEVRGWFSHCALLPRGGMVATCSLGVTKMYDVGLWVAIIAMKDACAPCLLS